MKKILKLVVFLGIVLIFPVHAKTIANEEFADDYYFKFQLGEITKTSIVRNLYDQTTKYYIIEEEENFFSHKNYEEEKSEESFQTLNRISKFIAYAEDVVLEQYIIYRHFATHSMEVFDKNQQNLTNYYNVRIEELNTLVQENYFDIDNKVTVNGDFLLSNYVYENFYILGEDILVEDHKIIFEKNESDYTVSFIPKYNCEDVMILHNDSFADLIGFNGICEKEYQVEFNNIKKDNIIEEEFLNQEEESTKINNINNSNTENMDEVASDGELFIDVPNTHKDSNIDFFCILLLGSLYYIFKK